MSLVDEVARSLPFIDPLLSGQGFVDTNAGTQTIVVRHRHLPGACELVLDGRSLRFAPNLLRDRLASFVNEHVYRTLSDPTRIMQIAQLGGYL